MDIRNIVILVFFILGLVYMQFINAHPVNEIIRKYAEARGGKEKLNSIESLYMEGLRRMMGNEIAVKITRVQGKLSRNDFEFNHTSGYTIVTPFSGWYLIPIHSPMVKVIPEERLKFMQTDLDIAGPLIGYAAKGNKAELEGKEDIDGSLAYKIKLTLKTGNEIFYFIDTKTFLLIQTKQMSTGIGVGENANTQNEKEVITNFSDYRFVDGIMFPYKISNPANGLDGGFTSLNKIELNVSVDEAFYEPSK